MILRRIFKKLFQKSRLSEYRSLLKIAIDEGYIITSLSDWYEQSFYPGKKVLVLRHDVDLLSKTALEMFLLEKELGVKSTYYFRWLTANSKIIKTIKEAGFEVSLHYETLATYCKKRKLFTPDKVGSEEMKDCAQILKTEIDTFERKFGKIKTLCSHGDKRNRILGIPNFKILEYISREDLGIYFETYDLNIKSKFNAYISDGSVNEQHQWKYNFNPKEEILKNTPNICLLTHPHHWSYSFKGNLIRLIFDFVDIIQNIKGI